MPKVSCSLIIFLSDFCVLASISATGALADNSVSTSPLSNKTVLHGGAEDAEKMQKSVKLMVPDAPASRIVPETRPSQLQTEVDRSELLQQSATSQALQEQRAAAKAAALQYQAEAGHRAMIERHFGAKTEYLRAESEPIKLDPWTDVVAVPYRQKGLAELKASIKRLHSENAEILNTVATGRLEPTAEKHVEPLRAVEKMLPVAPPPKDWDAWYKKVASAIYDRWRQNTAGPGTSVVLITVYDSRDVDCRVTDFTNAAGAAPNSGEESRFKQVSLQCVNGLSGDEIWQFPAVKPLPKKIVFDMEFKHVVGENSGCRIVHVHDDLPESSQR